MEFVEYKGKTVDDAITEACQALTITSDKLEYEIVEKGSSGILGFGSKFCVGCPYFCSCSHPSHFIHSSTLSLDSSLIFIEKSLLSSVSMPVEILTFSRTSEKFSDWNVPEKTSSPLFPIISKEYFPFSTVICTGRLIP